MSDPKKLIVVLGAHRSGTSLCAAAAEVLGADACLGEHYANEENRKGFYEHPDIVDFNDDLLAHLGGSWDNPLFLGAEELARADLGEWQARAVRLLRDIYGRAGVAVIKDPRICQLIPFWEKAFAAAGYGPGDVYYVHTLRDPVEVAISQVNRARANPDFYEYGSSLAEGAALWLSLTGQALEDAGDNRVLYLSYPALLTDPLGSLQRLAGFAGQALDPVRAGEFAEGFVDRSLYRSSADDASRDELRESLPQALELFSAASGLLREGDTRAVLAECAAIFGRADTRQRLAQIASPALSRLSERSRRDRLARRHSEEVATDLEIQAGELRDNTVRMREEHEAVLVPLRKEVATLQDGTRELQSQVGAQEEELARTTRIIEDLSGQKSRLETEISELLGQCEALDDELQETRGVVREMESSTSWRITRPLRSAVIRVRQWRHWMAGQWVQFRLRAILIYHRMSLRHPGLAWFIRRVLRPFFRLFNRLFSVGPRDMHQPADAGLLTPMRYQQYEASEHFSPLVSVIVPNYNHAPYLELRLESIFSQGYQNFEVILLDDASTDDSAEVLRSFHRRYPEKTTLVVNESNSGGVFHQWERGLNLARGEIVWIAESDDWCTENFLETLVPYFENEAIMLAYSRTVFMDGEGEQQIWSINEYLHDIDPQRWNHSIVETGPAIVRDAFAVKNIVPNVSSALFRTPRDLELLADPEWRRMRTCGDWVLYLHLLRGGMLAYSPAACNYYRIHGQNTSVGSYSQDEFYREHETVARTVRQFYDVPPAVFERLRDNLAIHWRETRGDFSEEALESCFSLGRIEASVSGRAPNLLMASYAFCSGGGETFPVTLANVMKRQGYNVTYLDCAREPRMEGVRSRLRSDIPVVSDFSQLERIIDDFDIELIHSHHAWVDSTILDLLPEDIDCKTVVTLHGMYETINEYDLRPILPRLVKRSARLIYVAEKNLEAIDRHGLLQYARTSRIDNALEDEAFQPVTRESLGIGRDAFVLTLVSRGMAEKGWAEGIQVVTGAREASGRDIHLVLVGDGPEYDRLLGEELPGYIHLEGFQPNVRGYFAAADIGFLPSKFRGESFPLVIIECLQGGVPFLACDLGEISRMLQGRDGMAGAVVPLDGEEVDLQSMQAEIVRLAGDSHYYEQLRSNVASAALKFDPALLAQKHDEAYREALRENGLKATA